MNHTEKVLPTASSLINSLPLDAKRAKAISEARSSIQQLISGEDPRLLLIVGPCSLHEEEAALEYASRLKQANERYSDDLYLVMRTYFAKPRSSEGWKGYIYDPFINNSGNIEQGLYLTRKLLLELNHFIPTAAEFLDLFTPPYLQDLLSWSTIGARTSASQIHRELASGLPLAVGFKNSVDGNIQLAIQAVKTAASKHHYLGLNSEGQTAVIQTQGNKHCHIILRGSLQATNYSEANIRATIEELTQAKLLPRLMIDCSHGNSGKQYREQIKVVETYCHYLENSFKDLPIEPLCGLMLESHLIAGKQKPAPAYELTYGQSITDACLSWEETEPLLEMLAKAKRKR